MTLLLMLRHGPTQWNAQKRIQGGTDIPLSAEGRSQVEKWRLPVQFKEFRCVSSPLARARETAWILGMEPETHEALREMSWGEWEGRVLPELRAELGDTMNDNESLGLDFRPPGGESPRDMQKRLRPWLRSLTKPTLAIAHKGVIRALYAMANGWDMREKADTRLEEGAAHLFKIDKQGNPTIERLNIGLEGELSRCM